MRKINKCMVVLGLLSVPLVSRAQMADDLRGLNGVLDNLYETMMPMCSQLIGVASAIGGFAALFYIAARVWRHFANAEAIDFYPLLRPFAIGFCILNFPLVLGLINGIMKPTVTGTANMMEGSNRAIEELLRQKELALQGTELWQMYVGGNNSGDKEKWYKYTYDEDISEEGWMESIGNDIRFAMEKYAYNFRNSVKEWLSEILRILFEAAALCINTLRTFQLVVLAILGPLVFAIAIFDGFQHTLTVWIARYINIFLWLPVANIFGSIIGKIQEEMLRLDLQQIGSDGYTTLFSPTDAGYLIFMIIAIVGYTTVPSVANYIVHAAGGSALQSKVSGIPGSGVAAAGAIATGGVGAALAAGSMVSDKMGDAAGQMNQNMASHGSSSPYMSDKLNGNSK